MKNQNNRRDERNVSVIEGWAMTAYKVYHEGGNKKIGFTATQLVGASFPRGRCQYSFRQTTSWNGMTKGRTGTTTISF
jgi:hypothetical protein